MLLVGHEKISFLQEHSGSVHGRPARDTVTGRKTERVLSWNMMAVAEETMRGVLWLSNKHATVDS